jgi:hypothetical protein
MQSAKGADLRSAKGADRRLEEITELRETIMYPVFHAVNSKSYFNGSEFKAEWASHQKHVSPALAAAMNHFWQTQSPYDALPPLLFHAYLLWFKVALTEAEDLAAILKELKNFEPYMNYVNNGSKTPDIRFLKRIQERLAVEEPWMRTEVQMREAAATIADEIAATEGLSCQSCGETQQVKLLIEAAYGGKVFCGTKCQLEFYQNE